MQWRMVSMCNFTNWLTWSDYCVARWKNKRAVMLWLNMYYYINSLWPRGFICWQRLGSPFPQAMKGYLLTPSHLPESVLTFHQVVFYSFHLRAISQEMLINLICNMNKNITLLKPFSHLPGAVELILSYAEISWFWNENWISNIVYLTVIELIVEMVINKWA